MNGRYKNQGGCHEGLLAELSNGGMAVVVKVDGELVLAVLPASSRIDLELLKATLGAERAELADEQDAGNG